MKSPIILHQTGKVRVARWADVKDEPIKLSVEVGDPVKIPYQHFSVAEAKALGEALLKAAEEAA